MITSWCDMRQRLRINPGAVARTLLTNLDAIERLTSEDESRVLYALKNCGVDNAADRVIASLSRNTLSKLLQEI